MAWSFERKYDAAVRAPHGTELWRPDSRGVERPGWRQLVTPSAKGYLNEVLLAQLAPEDADRVIEETIAEYAAHGLATKWYVGPTSRPEDLGERLTRRGFESWGVRAMGMGTEAPSAPPPAVEVIEVGDAELPGYLDTSLRGWSMGEDQRQLEHDSHARELAKRPRTAHFFLARIASQPVGTGGLFRRDGFGYLVGGQVLESARGQKVYRALISARLAWLRARGEGYAVTLAREATSAPLLEHLGFETLFRCKCYLLPFEK